MTNSSKTSITPGLKSRQTVIPERLPNWRLVVPLLLQTGLILTIPAGALYTQITGKTVVLQTVALDPYDPLRGYSQTLNYDISQQETLRTLPGWKELGAKNSEYLEAGTKLYVVLSAPNTSKTPPQAWKPVRVSSVSPDKLPANQIAIQGKSIGGSMVEYGVETYYMPESRRDEINQDIRQAQNNRQQTTAQTLGEWGALIRQARNSRRRQSVVVEVKVDDRGHAVPISFWVSDRNYRF